MALTNFNKLTTEQKTVWAMDVWSNARNKQFLNKFTGTSEDSMIQRITELKKDEKGTRAVITLVPDLEGDGVVGDNTLEGNEEEMQAYDQVITMDQMRHGNRNKGRLADQKSVVKFREQSKNKLAYWLADRCDQLTFLSLSGVTYGTQTNGAARVGSQFPALEFAGDVSAPSTNRYGRYDATNGLIMGATASNADLVAADTPTYEMLVELKAYAKERYVKPVRGKDGSDSYHVFLTPTAMSKLRLDPEYQSIMRNAGVRGSGNELFKGTDSVYIEGLWIHEYRHVYNTTGLSSGSKWGGGTVDGCRVLFCGAQAMGLADIGAPYWDEDGFDYNNQQGISVGKFIGLKKPVWKGVTEGTDEDFGVICVDVAQ